MEEGIKIRGMEIDYNYSPAVPQTHDYPGDPAEVEIYKVSYQGVEVSGLFFDLDEISGQKISEIICEEIKERHE